MKVKPLKVVYTAILKDKKLGEFLDQDFSTDKAKEVAKKNAFRLSAIHRSHLSAAFFCLANEPWLAVDACARDLNDLRLAFFVARVWDGPDGPIFTKFLKEFWLPSAKDNCESMIAQWWLGDASTGLRALIHEEAASEETFVKEKGYIPAAIALFDAVSVANREATSGTIERARLAKASAYGYIHSGCPILALQRCRHLLPGFNPATDAVVSSMRSTNIVACLAAGPRSNDNWDGDRLAVKELIEGCGTREPKLVAVQLAENYRCKKLLAAQCVATSVQGRDESLCLIWNESRQLIVTLYNLGASPLEGQEGPPALMTWRPRAQSWVRRALEVINGIMWLHETQEPGDTPVPVRMMDHITAHALCIAMATALSHHHYPLYLSILSMEATLARCGCQSQDQRIRGANMRTQFAAVTDVLNACLKFSINHSGEERDLHRAGKRPAATARDPDDATRALLDVYSLTQFRGIICRVLREDAHALTLRSIQIASTIDAWIACYEARIYSGTEVVELPTADDLEAAAASLGEGAPELWERLLRHPDVIDKVRFKRHAGWVQIETRWNWAAKNFIIEHGRLGQAEVGQEAPPIEDDAAWSAHLKNYFVNDGGVQEGSTPPLWKVELQPIVDGYPDYAFCAKTLEDQTDWISKLNRHCAQRKSPRSPKAKVPKRQLEDQKSPGSSKLSI